MDQPEHQQRVKHTQQNDELQPQCGRYGLQMSDQRDRRIQHGLFAPQPPIAFPSRFSMQILQRQLFFSNRQTQQAKLKVEQRIQKETDQERAAGVEKDRPTLVICPIDPTGNGMQTIRILRDCIDQHICLFIGVIVKIQGSGIDHHRIVAIIDHQDRIFDLIQCLCRLQIDVGTGRLHLDHFPIVKRPFTAPAGGHQVGLSDQIIWIDVRSVCRGKCIMKRIQISLIHQQPRLRYEICFRHRHTGLQHRGEITAHRVVGHIKIQRIRI